MCARAASGAWDVCVPSSAVADGYWHDLRVSLMPLGRSNEVLNPRSHHELPTLPGDEYSAREAVSEAMENPPSMLWLLSFSVDEGDVAYNTSLIHAPQRTTPETLTEASNGHQQAEEDSRLIISEHLSLTLGNGKDDPPSNGDNGE